VLASRAHHHLPDDHVVVFEPGVSTEAQVDLVGEGDGEGVVLDRALVVAARRLDRGERA
jgi:hypothetical protein